MLHEGDPSVQALSEALEGLSKKVEKIEAEREARRLAEKRITEQRQEEYEVLRNGPAGKILAVVPIYLRRLNPVTSFYLSVAKPEPRTFIDKRRRPVDIVLAWNVKTHTGTAEGPYETWMDGTSWNEIRITTARDDTGEISGLYINDSSSLFPNEVGEELGRGIASAALNPVHKGSERYVLYPDANFTHTTAYRESLQCLTSLPR